MAQWRPSARWPALRARAELMRTVRDFFERRGVLEVDTPIAGHAPNADANIDCLTTSVRQGEGRDRLYLRSSPEHAMKRLLAAGSGPIYQIGKVFRDGEAGHLHNPEFTLLEWYRPGWDHLALMEEVEALVASARPGFEAVRISYREAFVRYAEIDPWEDDTERVRAAATRLGVRDADASLTRSDYLDLVLTLAVLPRLGSLAAGVFVHGYPADQAALARLMPQDPSTAARFELFVDGIELANGYWELCDPVEQRARFQAERQARRAAGQWDFPLDERLLAALEAGLPECAGVALGVDRLAMLASASKQISSVLTFPHAEA